MVEISAAVLGALLGGVVALAVSLRLGRRQERVAGTLALIAEFFSETFLEHRISVSQTLQNIDNQVTDYDTLAGGYWYRGRPVYYTGALRGPLNEHQHLEAYLGYLVKMDYAIRYNRADPRELKATLSGGMVWHTAVVVGLAAAAERQATDAGARTPQWTGAARRICALMKID